MSSKQLSLLLLITLPVSSMAQVPELFEDVSDSDKAKAEADNEYFIKKEAYFAKRYRIVKVNADVLLGPNDELSLALFDGVSVRVRRQELTQHGNGTNFVWRGKYKEIPFGLQHVQAMNPGIDPKLVEHTLDSFTSLEFFGSQYVFDDVPANAKELAGMRQDPDTGRLLMEQDSLRHKVQTGTVVYSVISNFSPFVPNRSTAGAPRYSTISYQLRSLPMDRRYSILYEMDPQKQLLLSDDPSTLTPQQKKKARQYQQYLDSLGEPPVPGRTKSGGKQH